MKSTNPVFNEKAFSEAPVGTQGEVMTVDGTAIKAGVLGVLVVISAAWPWHQFFSSHISTAALLPYWLGGSIGGLIVAMITIFNKKAAPVTAPMYAILEGLTLGAISVSYEYQYPGIAIQAIGLTFAILGAMLFLYTTHILRPTPGFKQVVLMSTLGIAVYYGIAMLLMCFGVHAPLIWDSGWLGIGLSLFVSIVAAMNLIINFDFIDKQAERGAPKYMEWYGAFGLMVTLVWLYLEMLRLAAKRR